MWVWNPKTPQESINTSRRNPPAAVITEDTFTITCYFLTPHDIGRAIQGIYRPCWAPAWKITKSLMDALQGQRPNLLIEGAGLWGRYSTRKTSRMCTERNTTRDKDLKQKLLDMFWFKGEYGLTFPQHRHPTMFFFVKYNQNSMDMHGYVGPWRKCVLQLRRKMSTVSFCLRMCALKRWLCCIRTVSFVLCQLPPTTVHHLLSSVVNIGKDEVCGRKS